MWRQGGKHGHLESPRGQGEQQKRPCYGGRSGGKLHAKPGKRLCLVSLPILQDQGWAQKELIITITPTQGVFYIYCVFPHSCRKRKHREGSRQGIN